MEIVDDYFYDLVTLLIFYILVAISHQWSFISKIDKLCALHDDFSHLSIEASKAKKNDSKISTMTMPKTMPVQNL